MTKPGHLFDPEEFYDASADPWRPENLTPYLSPELVSDDSLHEWGTPNTWAHPTSPSSDAGVEGDGFGGWAA